MRARGIGFGIAALLAWVPTQVEAADLSAEAAIVSDYRYRGLSLSNRNPAVQFSATIEHDSGLYGNLWGSTIKEPGSEVATEVDFTAGYAGELAGGLSLDMAVTYFAYPADPASNYYEATITAGATKGDGSAFIGLSYVPRQSATRGNATEAQGNLYVFARGEHAIPGSPISLTAQIGYERGYFDESAVGGKWDWGVGAELAISPVTLGASLVAYSSGGRDGAGLTASMSTEF